MKAITIDPNAKCLLQGKPYTPAVKTNILETFKRLGWTPPSELKHH